MQTAPPTLETPRLRLRVPEPADAEAIFERYASDPEVTRFLSWPTHRSLDDTRAFVAWSREEWNRWPAGPYLICDRRQGRVLGSTGLTFETIDHVATGYVLARDMWGRGYATEALRAMVDLASAMGVGRLHAVCHVDHAVSRRVLEKAGFVFEGIRPRHTWFPNIDPDNPLDVCAFAYALGRTR